MLLHIMFFYSDDDYYSKSNAQIIQPSKSAALVAIQNIREYKNTLLSSLFKIEF